MAFVVLWAVLKIPVMSPGDTPPRCDRRRRRGRRFRRGIWTFGRPRTVLFFYTVLGVDNREDVR